MSLPCGPATVIGMFYTVSRNIRFGIVRNISARDGKEQQRVQKIRAVEKFFGSSFLLNIFKL